MDKYRIRIIAIAFVAAWAFVGTVFATTVVKMDLPSLVKEADRIVQARVDHIDVKWEDKMAYTYVYLNVEDPMKGERRSTAIIRQMGGQIGSLNVDVPGMPKFAPGEEVIVFLKDAGNGAYHVLGLNQGKYAVNDETAISNTAGIDVYNPKTGRLDTPALVDSQPVERLKSKIRGLLK